MRIWLPLLSMSTSACSPGAPDAAHPAWGSFPAGGAAWQVHGPGSAEIGPSPGGGSGMHLQSPGGTGFVAPRDGIPGDWSRATAVQFKAYRSPDSATTTPPVPIEVRIGSEASRTVFERDVELSHAGWATVTLPLRWFRPTGNGTPPHWDEITDFALRFEGRGDVWMDELALVPGDGAHPAWAGADDVARVGFNGEPVRILRTPAVEIVTDAPDLDMDRLAAHLAAVQRAMRSDMPFLAETVAPPLLVVSATREGQLRAIGAITRAFGGVLDSPPDAGFTLVGIATGTWDPAHGSLRSIYTHEYVHSVIARVRVLPLGHGDWLNEGLASHYQVRFHPESVRRDRSHGDQPDLTAVLDGGRVSIGDGGYDRAEATVDLLLHHPRYAPHAEALFHRFARSGSVALGPHLRPVLGVHESQFLDDWVARLASRQAP